jgi:hypothetical protein
MNINMKKIIFNLCALFVFALTMQNCTDVMNKADLERLTEENIWQDPVLTKGFMDKVIAGDNILPSNTGLPDEASDEGWGLYSNATLYDDISITSPPEIWLYTTIRNINKFLAKVDGCPASEANKNDWKGQMLVTRAWVYFKMVSLYGGVPLILDEQQLGDDLYVERTKTSECFKQMIADLDAAIALGDDFPIRRAEPEAGRINRAVALALKGRILLTYASPQFTKETPAGTKSADQRWQEAYTANQTAIQQLSAADYGLFRPNPANAAEAIKNRKDMFAEANELNSEMIWLKRHFPIISNYPDGVRNVPVEFVNVYANADGTPYTGLVFSGSSTTSSSEIINDAFWIGREPRFYTDIAYTGCKWPRYRNVSKAVDEDADGKMIHYWSFYGGQTPYADCSRTENNSIAARKMRDDDQKYNTPEGNRSGMDEPLFRYAELLLNFAECAAKTNHEAEAIKVLQDIRKRAGIPQGANNYGIGNPTGNALYLQIIKERQIELAFEGLRTADVRRWRLYTDPINGYKVNGQIRHSLKPRLIGIEGPDVDDAVLAATDFDANPASYFVMFNNEVHVLDTSSPIKFSEKQYFYPISFEKHIKKNPKLQQTQGWENGTFNPYE